MTKVNLTNMLSDVQVLRARREVVKGLGSFESNFPMEVSTKRLQTVVANVAELTALLQTLEVEPNEVGDLVEAWDGKTWIYGEVVELEPDFRGRCTVETEAGRRVTVENCWIKERA